MPDLLSHGKSGRMPQPGGDSRSHQCAAAPAAARTRRPHCLTAGEEILRLHVLARTEGGAEVDLVFETDDRIYGVEIKSGRTVGAQDTRGLESLGEVVGKGKPYTKPLAYTGQTRQRFLSKAEAWPWREVLEVFLGLPDVGPG